VSKTLQLPNGAPLILKGNIDRVHAAGGAIFILDYKTGQVKDKDLLLEEVSEDGLFIAKKAKLIQLLIYAYLSHHDLGIPLEKMKIGLFPLSAKEYEPAMLQQSAALLNIDFMRQFEEWIIHQAERMLETERFIHQEEAQYCQFCRETED
jgi:RecB family exonuclease